MFSYLRHYVVIINFDIHHITEYFHWNVEKKDLEKDNWYEYLVDTYNTPELRPLLQFLEHSHI